MSDGVTTIDGLRSLLTNDRASLRGGKLEIDGKVITP